MIGKSRGHLLPSFLRDNDQGAVVYTVGDLLTFPFLFFWNYCGLLSHSLGLEVSCLVRVLLISLSQFGRFKHKVCGLLKD